MRTNPKYAGTRGHTLVELTVVMIVIGVLASFGVPRFVHSLEQARVDMAATNLRAIWTAQRLYWLAHQTYAPDLNSLYTDPWTARTSWPTPDPSILHATFDYVCAVTTVSEPRPISRRPQPALPRPPGRETCPSARTAFVTGSVTGPDGSRYYPTPNFQ